MQTVKYELFYKVALPAIATVADFLPSTLRARLVARAERRELVACNELLALDKRLADVEWRSDPRLMASYWRAVDRYDRRGDSALGWSYGRV